MKRRTTTSSSRKRLVRDKNLMWMGLISIVCVSILPVAYLHSRTTHVIANSEKVFDDNHLIHTTTEKLSEQERRGEERRGEERKAENPA